MRIAQVAPLYESVPPKNYGGTERIVSYLTEGLIEQGHDVTLYASGDSQTYARLVPVCPRSLWHDEGCKDPIPHHLRMIEMVLHDASRFDIIHFHCDYLHFPALRRQPHRSVTTLHGSLEGPDVPPLLSEYSEIPLVAISNSQRCPAPSAHWQGTVYHGLPSDLHTFQTTPGSYLAFLGRVSPQKRLDRAISIATSTGIPLKIAAKIYPEERAYFNEVIQPMISAAGKGVEFVGEVGGPTKDAFLGNALAMLFPIDWSEPFGLVMIESLACGTPVIAWRNGAVPEILRDGVSGFIVDSVEAATEAVGRIGNLSRSECRREFNDRFDAKRMVNDYVEIYRRAGQAAAS